MTMYVAFSMSMQSCVIFLLDLAKTLLKIMRLVISVISFVSCNVC